MPIDMHEKYAIVYVSKDTSGKTKPILMSVDDAKAVKAGNSSKISPEMVDEVNWNPTIGQISYARGKGAKFHEEPGKGPTAKCANCGKKFEKYQTIRQEFLQEMAFNGGWACKKCAKKFNLL